MAPQRGPKRSTFALWLHDANGGDGSARLRGAAEGLQDPGLGDRVLPAELPLRAGDHGRGEPSSIR